VSVNYFCFIDIHNKSIIRISPYNKKRPEDGDNIFLAEISNEFAHDLISGKKSYTLAIILTTDNGYQVKEKEEILNMFVNRLDRIDSLSLKKINETTGDKNLDDPLNVKIRILTKQKLFIIEINEDILSCIKEPIKFYITRKDDPSMLYQIININKYVHQFKLNHEIDEISIFTKRIFNNYFLEIKHE